MPDKLIYSKISSLLQLSLRSVEQTVNLLEEGATIPFISRYRKEATGSLDEVGVGAISQAWQNFKALVKRKDFVLEEIASQGKLTDPLKAKLANCWDPTELEDLYLPYKKKRKTRATVAKDKGLEALADLIWKQNCNAKSEASQFLNKEVKDKEEALAGARDILAERINEDIIYRTIIRNLFSRTARLTSKVIAKKKEEAIKYKDYFDYSELASKAPGHRLLAVFRGEQEAFLRVKIEIEKEEAFYKLSQKIINRNADYACKKELELTIEDAYKRLLSPSIETEFRNLYKTNADQDAIDVFTENLKHLLLAPPLGTKAIMGIDPGFKSGCKVVCLDKNGDLLYNTAIYPHPPQQAKDKAKFELKKLAAKYNIEAFAIGNGTAGKETFALVKEIAFDKEVESFLVNENGASIYSASEIARNEFPDYDLTVRGAVSIGRRLMDPLSELVKIDPKSIGVGQYQHDVNQSKLKEHLTQCIEQCVNAVGINLNTASEHVLTYISGLGTTLAKNIVQYRTENGSFTKIETLKKVPRMGAKAFEQSAGFLRIRNGKNPLDNTGVHPERYNLVKAMAKDQKRTIEELLANENLIKSIEARNYIDSEVGLPTIKDILKELAKPGLDIRGAAKTFDFTEGLNSINDLREGMMVNGIINNVTKFGAFVDIGIKESGLIHVSQLSNTFVKDPMDVVKLNQEVNARVMEVDIKRGRISLSLKD
ncbi:MAG: hypothetical protein ACI959_000624 [Limisphaerales bacterium]|jgi:uncharacterized protein